MMSACALALPVQASESPFAAAAVDHVGIVVRDMPRAQQDFTSLGFRVHPGGQFPDGTFNTIISLADGSYLELLSYAPSGQANEIAEFARQHEGAMFAGLRVASAQALSDLLQARGFDASPPDAGTVRKPGDPEKPPVRWYTVGTADKPRPGKLTLELPIFFIQYLEPGRSARAAREGFTTHANGARALHAAWFAVADPARQRDRLLKAGFARARSRVALDGRYGPELQVGDSRLVLLAAEPASGQPEILAAVSIQVDALASARELVAATGADQPQLYAGAYGRSMLLPAQLTHGLRIELYQK